MRPLALTLLVLVHMDVAPVLAADWNPLASLPSARHGAAAATQGGKTYVLGGRWADDLSSATVFDPGPGSWSEASPMSQTRYQLGAAALGGFVYAVGGFAMDGMPTISVERLDPASNTWSTRSGMPTARAGMAVGVAGGGIVVAGGMSDEGMLGVDCYRYDPASDRWSVIGTLSLPRTGVACAVLGDRVWVMGGSNGAPSARVDVYDATSGLWSTGPDLPEALWLASAATMGDRVWVMGGVDATLMPSARVYSAGADGVWRSESPLPGALSAGFASTSSSDCLMLGGGLDGTGQPTASVWARCLAPPPPPPPINAAPVVNAGLDQDIVLPATAVLGGMASDDGLPSPPALITTWSVASGPGSVTFEDASAVDTRATFATAGTYVLRLSASDGELSGSDVVQVTVAPEPPPPPPPPPPPVALSVDVSLSPSSLNAGSQGNWISARIETHGWAASDILVETLRLDGVGPDPGAGSPTADANPLGGALTVKFPRAPLANRPNGDYSLALTGQRADATPFEGTAALSIHNGSATALHQNRPQPHALKVIGTVGSRASIAFTLAEPTQVILDVVDLQGRTVASIEDGMLPAGDYQRDWPNVGASVRSGMYLVRLRTPDDQGMARLPIVR